MQSRAWCQRTPAARKTLCVDAHPGEDPVSGSSELCHLGPAGPPAAGVVFRVEGNRAVLARTPDLLDLAGTVKVPAAKRNVAWDDVIRRTRASRAGARR